MMLVGKEESAEKHEMRAVYAQDDRLLKPGESPNNI
jgi:hypothetical protein